MQAIENFSSRLGAYFNARRGIYGLKKLRLLARVAATLAVRKEAFT
jgi:hypothetical protein